MIRKLRYMLLAGIAALAAPAAMAESCGPEEITTATLDLRKMLTIGTSDGQAQAAASRIDAQARACPETAWIRLIAAGAEINMLDRQEGADPQASTSLLAQRFAGAAGESRREVNVEWNGVEELTPWRGPKV
ncbi:MAG: hypothetical protein B7Z22_06145 [Hyphomonas sp. 32-62-5]|nr:MAG: hypothetical protein B7Z22_06145 [Hyphomonas sp. 32-62-5]